MLRAVADLPLVFDNSRLQQNKIEGKVFDVKYSLLNDVKEEKKRKFYSQVCFNCGQSGHSIRDCKKSKNFAHIQQEKVRFQFFSSFQSNAGVTRYHNEGRTDSKFKRFKPGYLSSSLRKALNLGYNEAPVHVYKMRIYGYPPGWLEYAKVQNADNSKSSNLSIFGCDSLIVSDDSGEEDGQCGQIVDPDRIISYKGFNRPLDGKCRDLHNRYHCPAFSRSQKKTTYIHNLNNKNTKKSGKKRKLSPNHVETEPNKKVKLSRNDESVSDESVQKSPTNRIDSEDLDSISDHSYNDSGIEVDQSINSSVEYGTPILTSISPYTKTPKVENFAKNMNPLLFFDNLPNTTGNFEKLNNIISRLRVERN